MEPAECLEPLNLVIKKDDTDDSGGPTVIGEKIAEASIDEEKDAVATEDNAIEDNMAILQDAVKSVESGGLPTADHKLLTALYMSSLMQMSSLSAPRGIAPPPYGGNQQQQQSFMQLLAMVEARHRMWQQMNWPLPQSFLRNPLTLPPTAPPYFDGATPTPTPTPTPNLTEQLSQNTAPTYPLSCAKPEPLNPEAKQSYFNKRYTNPPNEQAMKLARGNCAPLDSRYFFSPMCVLQVHDRAEKLHVVTYGQFKSSGHGPAE